MMYGFGDAQEWTRKRWRWSSGWYASTSTSRWGRRLPSPRYGGVPDSGCLLYAVRHDRLKFERARRLLEMKVIETRKKAAQVQWRPMFCRNDVTRGGLDCWTIMFIHRAASRYSSGGVARIAVWPARAASPPKGRASRELHGQLGPCRGAVPASPRARAGAPRPSRRTWTGPRRGSRAYTGRAGRTSPPRPRWTAR